jgi:hypothetical protein
MYWASSGEQISVGCGDIVGSGIIACIICITCWTIINKINTEIRKVGNTNQLYFIMKTSGSMYRKPVMLFSTKCFYLNIVCESEANNNH